MSHITCVHTNTQRGDFRFPDPATRPRIKKWRCELTALSRVHNLYFVAYSKTIHVYQPSFPGQTLSEEPALAFSPPVSAPNLAHFIDPQTPHSINRLHIDYLGREEIILTAHDDGDVVGYYVSAIYDAIKSQLSKATHEDPLRKVKLHPFFHKNVVGSAWGLAVHREARMIAISANSHLVTVVEFELAGHPPSEGRPHRTITLTAEDNIPALSFDNTDPSGRILASSGIDGKTLVWDLEKPERPARTIQIGHCPATKYTCEVPADCPCGDYAHGMWGALFVDPLSCHDAPLPTGLSGLSDVTDAELFLSHFLADQDELADNGGVEIEEPPLTHLVPTLSLAESNTDAVSPRSSLYYNETHEHNAMSAYRSPLVLISRDAVFILHRPNYALSNDEWYMTAKESPIPTNPQAGKFPGTVAKSGHGRINYHHYVPELGIFLLASAYGCAVYSLLRAPSRPDGSRHSTNACIHKMEYNLPFADDITHGMVSIVGIAVGPVQGRLDDPKEMVGDEEDTSGDEEGERQTAPRRYRLMILCSDHTVLSYELELRRGDGELTVADLVV